MAARNTNTTYGWIARTFHWLVALAVVGMFALGLWMRSLDYYDPWYQPAPALHISIGLILIVVVALRIAWRMSNAAPDPASKNALENRAASTVHLTLYALLIALMASGYVYATAEGRPADIFGLIEVPAVPGSKELKGTVGWVHEYLAYAVIALASLHALAALKHHFIDRDDTLRRMISGSRTASPTPTSHTSQQGD